MVVPRSVVSAGTLVHCRVSWHITRCMLLVLRFCLSCPTMCISKLLIVVQQAQLPDSGGGAGERSASNSWFDAAVALPRIATSVINIGSLLQQEQALFMRVGSVVHFDVCSGNQGSAQ